MLIKLTKFFNDISLNGLNYLENFKVLQNQYLFFFQERRFLQDELYNFQSGLKFIQARFVQS